MSATSLATKGVICRRTIAAGPIIGGGGPPMGKRQEELLKPKIKILGVHMSEDKKELTEDTFKITGLKLVID